MVSAFLFGYLEGRGHTVILRHLGGHKSRVETGELDAILSEFQATGVEQQPRGTLRGGIGTLHGNTEKTCQ